MLLSVIASRNPVPRLYCALRRTHVPANSTANADLFRTSIYRLKFHSHLVSRTEMLIGSGLVALAETEAYPIRDTAYPLSHLLVGLR